MCGCLPEGLSPSEVRDMAIRGVEYATDEPVDIVEEDVTTPDQS